MNRSNQLKLVLTRNWSFPGKERLARWLNPPAKLKSKLVNGIIWFNNEDIAIYASADNYIEYTIITTGTYEDEINKLINISLKPGDNALDIGANIGIQSIRMSKIVGKAGNVYAFEPLRHLQDKFKNNQLLNKSEAVTLFPFALSDQESETSFEISPDAWNQGTFSLTAQHTGTQKQTVSVKVADNLPELKKLPSLALIKIDVEGFEFHVLRGLQQTMRQFKPRIIFEYDSNYWAKTGQSITACYQMLTALGYTLYQITQVGCILIDGAQAVASGNIFCIPAIHGQ